MCWSTLMILSCCYVACWGGLNIFVQPNLQRWISVRTDIYIVFLTWTFCCLFFLSGCRWWGGRRWGASPLMMTIAAPQSLSATTRRSPGRDGGRSPALGARPPVACPQLVANTSIVLHYWWVPIFAFSLSYMFSCISSFLVIASWAKDLTTPWRRWNCISQQWSSPSIQAVPAALPLHAVLNYKVSPLT
jgi:hypothetical protein